MSKILPEFAVEAFHALPEPVRSILSRSSKIHVSGGYLRSIVEKVPPTDIDIFFEDNFKGIVEEAESILTKNGYEENGPKGCPIWSRPLEVPIQLVKFRWYNPVSVAEGVGFDFTNCSASLFYTEYGHPQVLAHSSFLEDVNSRTLNFLSNFSKSSTEGLLSRCLKFYAMGYRFRDLENAKAFSNALKAEVSDNSYTGLKLKDLWAVPLPLPLPRSG